MSFTPPEFQKIRRLPSSIKRGLDINSRDMFDRIINLKFYRRDAPPFCIRSDYEPVFSKAGVSFKRCVQKPSIKVSYKQVANSVSIKVNIEVTNLFVNAAGGTEMLRAEKSPIERIDVYMGYISQFPDWTDNLHRTFGTAAQFFNLDDNTQGLTSFKSDPHPEMPSAIRVTVLSSHTSGLPPDQATVFNGIIGTEDPGLLWDWTEEDATKTYGLPDSIRINDVQEAKPGRLGYVLFQWITRRFPGSGVHARVITHTGKERFRYAGGTEEYEQTVITSQRFEVLGYSALKAGTAIPADATWETVDTVQNLLKPEDAIRFGVKCYVSDYLRRKTLDQLYRHYLDGLSVEEQAEYRGIVEKPFTTNQLRLGGTLDDIAAQFPFIRWYPLPDGSLYFHHADEKSEDILTDSFVRYKQGDVVFLPAVYDIQMAGTRTIRAPFVSFIGPMTTVAFQSRYAVGSLVGFFYHPDAGDDQYLVLLNDIEFSTTGGTNMMTMTCQDVEGPYKARIDARTGTTMPAPDVAAVPETVEPVYTWAWKKRTAYRYRPYDEASFTGVRVVRVYDVAQRLLYSQLRYTQTPYSELELFQVVDLLVEWNPDLFKWENLKNAGTTGVENMTRFGVRYLEYAKAEHPEWYPAEALWAFPFFKKGMSMLYKYPLRDEYPEHEQIPQDGPTEDS
jgi:hypothetical protein